MPALPGRAPPWLLVALVVVISVGGPASMIGFDVARTFNPSATPGTAKGIVNMAGFFAALLVMQAMGMILEITGAGHRRHRGHTSKSTSNQAN